MESITIPDNVLLININAFNRCRNLKTLTIGNGIKGIRNEDFKGCSSLKSFNIGAKELYSEVECYIDNNFYSSGYGERVFLGCSALSLNEQKKDKKHRL